jgi:hypothetical protein
MTAPQLINTLTRRYSRLLGELRQAEARCDALRASMEHIEATIAMFDDRWVAGAVKPTRPRAATARPLRHGTATRMALDVLRVADGPMTAVEIADCVAARCGLAATDHAAAAKLSSAIAATLKNKIGKTVAADDGRPRRWWIQQQGEER